MSDHENEEQLGFELFLEPTILVCVSWFVLTTLRLRLVPSVCLLVELVELFVQACFISL